MEYLILTIGLKKVCFIFSIIGGLFNYNNKKVHSKKGNGRHINWLMERKKARIDLFLNICIAIVSVELFIPPLMATFDLHTTFAPALAFFIGFSGIRLMPAIEQKIKKTLDKF
tara:strand:+ start:59 stop:397 length:339 start_codon:yes stop_codon:yes gene_type:complete